MSTKTPRKELLEKEFSLLTPTEFNFFYNMLYKSSHHNCDQGDVIYNQVLSEFYHHQHTPRGSQTKFYAEITPEHIRSKEWMNDLTPTSVSYHGGNMVTSCNNEYRMIIGMARERKWLRDKLAEELFKSATLENKLKEASENDLAKQTALQISRDKFNEEVAKSLELQEQLQLYQTNAALILQKKAEVEKASQILENSKREYDRKLLEIEKEKNELALQKQQYEQELLFLREARQQTVE